MITLACSQRGGSGLRLSGMNKIFPWGSGLLIMVSILSAASAISVSVGSSTESGIGRHCSSSDASSVSTSSSSVVTRSSSVEGSYRLLPGATVLRAGGHQNSGCQAGQRSSYPVWIDGRRFLCLVACAPAQESHHGKRITTRGSGTHQLHIHQGTPDQ